MRLRSFLSVGEGYRQLTRGRAVLPIKTEVSVSRDTKKRHGKAVSLMAAGEGFEPSHTESESAVLPLHNPAMF